MDIFEKKRVQHIFNRSLARFKNRKIYSTLASDELKELKDIERPFYDLEEGETDDKKLPSENTADIASNIALASFCSNSMNSAIDSNT